MEPPSTLTREQVRRVDEIAVTKYGMSSLVLMENAGRGVVDVLLAVDPQLATPRRRSVAIFCGKGNNAGDGFVIARHLDIRGIPSLVVLLCPPIELTSDARRNFDLLDGCSGVIRIHSLGGVSQPTSEEPWEAYINESTWMIDAMLGTGAHGEPREPFAAAIRRINNSPGRRLAVDVPSGLDCDTGVPAAATIRADVTCTFVALKPGFLNETAKPYLGDVHVVSIGVPPRLVQEDAGV